MAEEVVIMLSNEAAKAVHENRQGADLSSIQELIRNAGGSLLPVHPGTEDPELARYFFVKAKDRRHAEQLADALQSVRGVEAAYVKPPGETP
jgi:hypothetical protein